MGEHSAATEPDSADLLQPPPLSRAQFGRAALQQDHAVSAVAIRSDKLTTNYLAFIQLASVRL